MKRDTWDIKYNINIEQIDKIALEILENTCYNENDYEKQNPLIKITEILVKHLRPYM